MNDITITKKVTNHGGSAVIVVPSDLRDVIRPGMLVQATIRVIDKEAAQ
jgi:hypothetical protein